MAQCDRQVQRLGGRVGAERGKDAVEFGARLLGATAKAVHLRPQQADAHRHGIEFVERFTCLFRGAIQHRFGGVQIAKSHQALTDDD